MTYASDCPPSSLVIRTVEIPDPGPLLALIPTSDALSWVRAGTGLVGWGQAARWSSSEPAQRFQTAAQWWAEVLQRSQIEDSVGLAGTGAVAFGSFAFDPQSPAGSVLILPQTLVGSAQGRWWMTTVTPAATAPSQPQPSPAVRPTGWVRFTEVDAARHPWQAKVAAAIAEISTGRTEKIVLARAISGETEHPIDRRQVLQSLAENYPGCWTFAVDNLLGATPELLVRLERGLVHSRVLAGTIQRSGAPEQDAALAGSLAHSSKDLREHEFAVRSLAQALAPLCDSMNVPETPFVLHLANVMHLATDVTAVTAQPTSVLDLVAALHPTAAVGGTPTAAALCAIRELEQLDRGRYAGPVGWIDHNLDGEWAIALRCAELDPTNERRVRLFAGCGIVASSDPATELAESTAKLIPMRAALSAQGHGEPGKQLE